MQHKTSSVGKLQYFNSGQAYFDEVIQVDSGGFWTLSFEFLVLSPVSTTRVDGPRWRVTGFHYPSTRAVLTGNGNRSPVNSGSGNRALVVVIFHQSLLFDEAAGLSLYRVHRRRGRVHPLHYGHQNTVYEPGINPPPPANLYSRSRDFNPPPPRQPRQLEPGMVHPLSPPPHYDFYYSH